MDEYFGKSQYCNLLPTRKKVIKSDSFKNAVRNLISEQYFFYKNFSDAKNLCFFTKHLHNLVSYKKTANRPSK